MSIYIWNAQRNQISHYTTLYIIGFSSLEEHVEQKKQDKIRQKIEKDKTKVKGLTAEGRKKISDRYVLCTPYGLFVSFRAVLHFFAYIPTVNTCLNSTHFEWSWFSISSQLNWITLYDIILDWIGLCWLQYVEWVRGGEQRWSIEQGRGWMSIPLCGVVCGWVGWGDSFDCQVLCCVEVHCGASSSIIAQNGTE